MIARPETLSLRHALLAVAVAAVWGSNFVVIRVGLDHLPPLLFATLRFTFSLLPAVFFLARPAVPWRNLAAYGILVGAGQFGVLYIAMNGYVTPGLASLVVQSQVFFTIAIASIVSGERIRSFHIAGLAIAAAGIAVILMHTDATTTPLGLALVLFAALSWAGSNIVARATPNVGMLAYVVWASLFCVPPLLVLSLLFEGWPRPATASQTRTRRRGRRCCGRPSATRCSAMRRGPGCSAAIPTIAPMALLVPVFGMGASALLLGEPLQDWKLAAAALIMAGLCINVLWPRLVSLGANARRDPKEIGTAD